MIENVMQNARLGGRFFCVLLYCFSTTAMALFHLILQATHSFHCHPRPGARKRSQKIRALFPALEKCSYPVYVALFSQKPLEDRCDLRTRCAALWLEGIGGHAGDIALPSRTSSEQRLVLLPASVTQRESAAKWQPLELASLPPAVEGCLR